MAHDGRRGTATRLPGAVAVSWWSRAFSDEEDEPWADPPRARPTAHPVPPRRPRRPEPAGPATSGVRQAPAEFARPARAVQSTGPERIMLLAAFWLGLVATVLPWWLHTSPDSLRGTGPLLTGAGRVTGLVAGYALIVQVLLMSRFGWLDRWIGARRLVRWHRELGGFLVVTVLAHAALITVGYAWTDHRPILGETWTVLTTYEDMISAFVAAGVLAGIGLLAVNGLRRALPYEVWYYLHASAYLVLLLGYGHQFADGHDLADAGPARYYWAGLYVLVIAAVAWSRVLVPLWYNLRHGLRVIRVVEESPDTVSVYVGGRRLDVLGAKAGQFFRWRFLAPRCWWQSHPFSLSAAPNGQWLRLTVKAVGDHTAGLRRLRPGTRVVVEGPAGEFTADRRTRTRALLIAAGSGIAPIRALLEELPPQAVVIYRASRAEDLVFRRELDWLAQARGADVWYVVGSRHDPGPRRLFTPEGLRELVPDVAQRDVYLCGPPGLMESAVTLLRRLRLPRKQIHLDPFEF